MFQANAWIMYSLFKYVHKHTFNWSSAKHAVPTMLKMISV